MEKKEASCAAKLGLVRARAGDEEEGRVERGNLLLRRSRKRRGRGRDGGTMPGKARRPEAIKKDDPLEIDTLGTQEKPALAVQ